MKYIKFTYIDKATGAIKSDSPGEPAFPKVDGLVFSWANESEYPTSFSKFFGTCPDSSNTDVPGVLEVLSESEWELAKIEEMDRRYNRPNMLTAKQIRLVLLKNGLLDSALDIIKSLPENLKIEWDYATEVYQNSKLIKEIATQLNLFDIVTDPDNEKNKRKIDILFEEGKVL